LVLRSNRNERNEVEKIIGHIPQTGIAIDELDKALSELKGASSMKLTKQWLNKQSACSDGLAWWTKCGGTDPVRVCKKLIAEKRFAWCGWLLARVLDKTQRVLWAIYCAEQVLDIFEVNHPKDDRPRKAIQAAKDYLAGKITIDEVRAAAAYADSAAYAAAANAAYADSAAYAAANAAAYAANAAYAAAYAAANAAADAAYAAYAADAPSADADFAKDSMYVKVLTKGIEMIGGTK
jgi:hypothetical protein